MIEPLTEEQMRQRLREKYPDHFGHAWTLFEFAQDALGRFEGDAHTPLRKAMAFIGGRAFKSYHAILNLCEIAYTEDAAVILRSLFNLLVITRWLIADQSEERARKYIAWFWIAMNEDLGRGATTITPELAAMVREQYENHRRIFEYRDEHGQEKTRKKWHEPEAANIFEMAEQVELMPHYEGLYRPLSSIEHSDAVAYFAMVSAAEPKGSGLGLALHSDLFVPAYVRNAFQYFGEILSSWNRMLQGVQEAELKKVIDTGMQFFRKEVPGAAEAQST